MLKKFVLYFALSHTREGGLFTTLKFFLKGEQIVLSQTQSNQNKRHFFLFKHNCYQSLIDKIVSNEIEEIKMLFCNELLHIFPRQGLRASQLCLYKLDCMKEQKTDSKEKICTKKNRCALNISWTELRAFTYFNSGNVLAQCPHYQTP